MNGDSLVRRHVLMMVPVPSAEAVCSWVACTSCRGIPGRCRHLCWACHSTSKSRGEFVLQGFSVKTYGKGSGFCPFELFWWLFGVKKNPLSTLPSCVALRKGGKFCRASDGVSSSAWAAQIDTRFDVAGQKQKGSFFCGEKTFACWSF